MSSRAKEYVAIAVAALLIAVAALTTFSGLFSDEAAVTPSVVPAQPAPAESVPSENTSAKKYFFSVPEKNLSEASSDTPTAASPRLFSVPELTSLPPEPEVSRVPAPISKIAATRAKPPRRALKSFNCVGQICIDADTGEVLSSRNANVRHPPASVTKLMTLFLVLDAVDSGKLRLSDRIVASRRAQDMGGTQVHLAAGEVNSAEDLLYALMLQSANDAAVALAEKVGGNVEDFVAEMNRKARELGLTQTEFSSPHGLPVSKKDRAAGKKDDMTSASDLARLSRALIRAHPEIFRYTSAKSKIFRENRFGVKPLPMSNHNTLLRLFPGCDGLKTGWTNAGASIVTTASRGNRRVIAVVLGGLVRNQKGEIDPKTSQRERNQRAAELMFDGLEKIDALKYEPTPRQF